jgi:glycosyltransferase involved in cell wall biosynthesis
MIFKNNKPHILLIADVPNWIFARHCKTIKSLLSDEFKFTIKCFQDKYNEADYDLIYPLEFNLMDPAKIKNPAKYVTGIRSHLTWEQLDTYEFATNLSTNFQKTHAVSKRLYNMLSPFIPNMVYLAHGIDTKIFTPYKNMQSSPKGSLKLGFAGNRDSKQKRFNDFVAPLANIKGVELVFCGYDSKNLTIKKMPKFYQSIDAYICASDKEGHNNSLLEAGAMERAIITTNAGSVPEYLKNNENALIVEQELPNFIQAVIKLRDAPALRNKLGKAARPQVINKFSWDEVIKGYRELFVDALNNKDKWSPKQSELTKQLKP